jgi:hypothetical protein
MGRGGIEGRRRSEIIYGLMILMGVYQLELLQTFCAFRTWWPKLIFALIKRTSIFFGWLLMENIWLKLLMRGSFLDQWSSSLIGYIYERHHLTAECGVFSNLLSLYMVSHTKIN